MAQLASLLVMNPLLLAPMLLLTPTVEVPVVWTGGHSKVVTASTKLITSQPEWIMSWNQNGGNAKRLQMWQKLLKERPEEVRYDYYNEDNVPEVDFQSSTVLAMFGGQTHQVAGYSFLGTVREGDTLTLRYVPRYYSVAISKPSDQEKFRNTPYAYFLLPRNFKQLRIEEGIIERKGDPITKFKLIKTLNLTGR